jgi:DNA polymerase
MSDQNRRAVFLDEMGLGPVWSQRTGAPQLLDEPVIADDSAESGVHMPKSRADESMSSAWTDSAAQTAVQTAATAPQAALATASATSVTDVTQMDWAQLKSAVATCTKCDLCKSRTQTVFGVGDPKARWLFVGEGPGRNEDFQGEPFVGPAGKLLDNMFAAMALKRGDNTYIANIVKCRPTDAAKGDRPPAAEEMDACLPYLERQIALIKPAIIVALGKTAALALLKLDPATPVSSLRGTVHRHADVPVIVTYHPAYLLRKPKDKSKAWADLCLAMQSYAGSASK